MFRKYLLLFLFSLLNALGAQAVPVSGTPITSLPFTISAPGTYVLASDLTPHNNGLPNGPAINILTTISGSVTLDLNGHAILGPGNDGDGIDIGFGSGPTNTFPIVIQNGIIDNCQIGIQANSNSPLNSITISNITFNYSSDTNATGVLFFSVSSSVIQNCTFNGPGSTGATTPTQGIYDYQSPGGNSYSNCTFTNLDNPIRLVGFVNPVPTGLTPTSLSSCQFQ